MGMKKAVASQDLGTVITTNPPAVHFSGNNAVIPNAESGAEAAIERLSKVKAPKAATPTYKARDYDAEARGKVKCVMFEAALQSPAIAGLKFDSLEDFLILVEKAAEAGVKYTWKE